MRYLHWSSRLHCSQKLSCTTNIGHTREEKHHTNPHNICHKYLNMWSSPEIPQAPTKKESHSFTLSSTTRIFQEKRDKQIFRVFHRVYNTLSLGSIILKIFHVHWEWILNWKATNKKIDLKIFHFFWFVSPIRIVV